MSKKDIVKYIIDEYGVTSPTDITNALKDLLGETLQDMLNLSLIHIYTYLITIISIIINNFIKIKPFI